MFEKKSLQLENTPVYIGTHFSLTCAQKPIFWRITLMIEDSFHNNGGQNAPYITLNFWDTLYPCYKST
jgi:hypothetical protein